MLTYFTAEDCGLVKVLDFLALLSPSPQWETDKRNIFFTWFYLHGVEVSIISAASVMFIKYCRELWQVSCSSLQSELPILFLNKVGASWGNGRDSRSLPGRNVCPCWLSLGTSFWNYWWTIKRSLMLCNPPLFWNVFIYFYSTFVLISISLSLFPLYPFNWLGFLSCTLVAIFGC